MIKKLFARSGKDQANEHKNHDDIPETPYTAQERARVAKRTTLVSVLVNIVLSIMQIVVGYFARSQALIADGIHSLSDLMSDFVVLVANHHSQKDPDDDHPYGHQRFETAASLFIGVILILVAAGMVWAAIDRAMDPTSIPDIAPIALAIAVLTLFTKEGLFRFMLSAAKRVKSGMLVANAWHARSDAASSLVVAIGILGSLLGYKILDPIAALIVGLMIARMGWRFAFDAFNDLMDRGIDEQEVKEITETLRLTPGVLGVHDVRTRKMGDMVMVDAHIEVNRTYTVEQGHDIAVAAREAVVRRHRVLDLMAHVDPVDPADPVDPVDPAHPVDPANTLSAESPKTL
jgi:cation diffusion facilitator family transporter